MKKRVLLAGLYHESNTFLRGTSGLSDFDVKTGEEIWAAEGDVSPLSGTLEVGQASGWDLMPLVDMRATPGATVSDEVVEYFWDVLLSAAERGATREVDGVYLVLHGAMVSGSSLDVEGEVLSRIRRLPGLAQKPLCGVVDLHANFTAAMAEHSTGLIAYRENPHIDAKEVAMEAAGLLNRLMETGERPITLWEQPPVMWPPSSTGTATDPMRSLEEKARSCESENSDLLAINVLAGFPFADVPEAGVGILYHHPGRSRSSARDLEGAMRPNRLVARSRQLDWRVPGRGDAQDAGAPRWPCADRGAFRQYRGRSARGKHAPVGCLHQGRPRRSRGDNQ